MITRDSSGLRPAPNAALSLRGKRQQAEKMLAEAAAAKSEDDQTGGTEFSFGCSRCGGSPFARVTKGKMENAIRVQLQHITSSKPTFNHIPFFP